jgi:hypothetical protein
LDALTEKVSDEHQTAIQQFRTEIQRIKDSGKSITHQELQRLMNAHQLRLKQQLNWFERLCFRIFFPTSPWGYA